MRTGLACCPARPTMAASIAVAAPPIRPGSSEGKSSVMSPTGFHDWHPVRRDAKLHSGRVERQQPP